MVNFRSNIHVSRSKIKKLQHSGGTTIALDITKGGRR
jgi:hypothetical protein